MAEGDDTSPERFGKRITFSDDPDPEDRPKLDLGLGPTTPSLPSKSYDHNFGASTSGFNEQQQQQQPRREENPFSFKHFLRNDANYQQQGARPKVYCDGRPISSVSDLDLHQIADSKQTRIVPEFSAALPDFVQDHLVVEQCYLGKDPDNLPDFAPSRASVNVNRVHVDSGRDDEQNGSLPFDLPLRPQAEFPLDLPTGETQPNVSRGCPSAEVGVSKSLPDFLADGAAQSRANDLPPGGHSPIRDPDRFQHELELARRQLAEQVRICERLQKDVDNGRSREHEYTQNLAKALEQAEESLERSNKRVASAEETITKLRQENKALTYENKQLRRENASWRSEEGAAGGSHVFSAPVNQSSRLASELRTAANTAEHSLRQLLLGLDNLRMMASSVENMHRIHEDSDYYDSDRDAGPTL